MNGSGQILLKYFFNGRLMTWTSYRDSWLKAFHLCSSFIFIYICLNFKNCNVWLTASGLKPTTTYFVNEHSTFWIKQIWRHQIYKHQNITSALVFPCTFLILLLIRLKICRSIICFVFTRPNVHAQNIRPISEVLCAGGASCGEFV